VFWNYVFLSSQYLGFENVGDSTSVMEEKNEREKKKKKKERKRCDVFVCEIFCACLPPVVWNFSVPNKGMQLLQLCTMKN